MLTLDSFNAAGICIRIDCHFSSGFVPARGAVQFSAMFQNAQSRLMRQWLCDGVALDSAGQTREDDFGAFARISLEVPTT
jgi:hypothetical protein